MTSQEDVELLLDFKIESLEHLGEIEPLFLEIEETSGDAQHEIINGIFRAVHSVKGAAGFFGLDLIQNLSHAMENLLMCVRDGQLAYQPEVTDALLKGLDKLRPLVEGLPEKLDCPIDEEVGLLAALAEGKGPSAKTQKAKTTKKAKTRKKAKTSKKDEAPESAELEADSKEKSASTDQQDSKKAGSAVSIAGVEPNPARLAEAKRFGRNLTLLEIPADEAENLEKYRHKATSVGSILGENASLSSPLLLVSSVLDADLLATELGLPEGSASVYSDDGGSASEQEKSKADDSPGTPKKEALSKEAVENKSVDPTPPKPVAKAAGTGPTREPESTIRVQVGLLDQLMNLAGELVLVRNQLLSSLSDTEDPAIKAVLQSMSLVTSEMQGSIMNTRMQPVGGVFKKFHRIVRDMSRKLGKKVELELVGTEVELDKSIIEMLSDPLTHLVRNSLDHGLETPDQRIDTDKEPTGRIALRAFHQGGQVNIEIWDDGRGIDADRMRESAVTKGVMTREEADLLSDQDAVQLIFMAGFSTAEKVTDVSGRGVGMDVVKSNISKLGGKIDVETEMGRGTTIRVRLPLTLAIIPSLVVSVGEDRFAVPQVNLVELVRVKAGDTTNRIENVRGASVLRLRGNLLPLVRLDQVLGIQRTHVDSEAGEAHPDDRKRIADRRETKPEASTDYVSQRDPDRSTRRANLHSSTLHVLVLRVDENRYGLIVDRVQDSEEIVVKPLSDALKGCKSFAGATIMGDGRVAMILDVSGIATGQNLKFTDLANDTARSLEEEKSDRSSRELILFRNSAEEQFAVDLDQIVRLERIDRSQIEKIGNREYVQYLGRGLPLIRLEKHLAVRPMESERDELFVLIPRAEHVQAGILVSEVIDTIESHVTVERSSDDDQAIEGRAIVDGRLTIFLDTNQLLGKGAEAAL
jgi:two-component system chemotaxis sensor kinase CheA